MPYITQEYRALLDRKMLEDCIPMNAGELQYCIAVLIRNHLAIRKFHYQVINDVVGALEGAKQEFYRRIAAPYETIKIAQNGDVYDAAD